MAVVNNSESEIADEKFKDNDNESLIVDDTIKDYVLISAALSDNNGECYNPKPQPIIEGTSSSNFSSLHGNNTGGMARRLIKLSDEYGNEYLLQPNGVVHLIKKEEEILSQGSPSGGSEQNIFGGGQQPSNLYNPNLQRKPTGRKGLRRLKSFIDLSKHSNRAAPDQLREFQVKVLDSIQYSGDLLMGTTNRYGDVDSTAKIIRSATNSTRTSSISSSFRTSTIRTSSISSPSQSSEKKK
ncbi:hypothetical protein JA1_000202 [Spathaspora sp. JA1]|nr:hypothetical protein JA1_000202 [Spathaspora sp. JA1]